MNPTAPTRTLVVGSGGREHALVWKLAAEPGTELVAAGPGSDAIAAEPRVRRLAHVDPLDPAGIVAAARTIDAGLVVVGPEAPLAAGAADGLQAAGFPVFGPTRAAARIETSKAFCHEVAAAAGVRMAAAGAFARLADAVDFARWLDAEGRGIVVKADGLAAGKGVTVCGSLPEAEAALGSCFAAGDGTRGDDPVVVVEERLTGREASVIAVCDGREALALPAARDHKRLLDGDRGPNTGGMGAFSPVPDLPDAAVRHIVETVHRPILAELARRGSPFRGALYAGLMLTDEGPALLECNARFGDPETQAILPRLDVALGPLLLAAARGDLAAAVEALDLDGPLLPARPEAAVAIVLAAGGYPAAARRGDPITGLDAAAAGGALVFHAGTAGGPGAYRTAGGRVLAVVGRGMDLAAARSVAEAGADAIHFDGAQRRRDIGVMFAVADSRPAVGEPAR